MTVSSLVYVLLGQLPLLSISLEPQARERIHFTTSRTIREPDLLTIPFGCGGPRSGTPTRRALALEEQSLPGLRFIDKAQVRKIKQGVGWGEPTQPFDILLLFLKAL